MDCKLTSQSVKVSETVLRQTLEQPFDEEFTLPDYCPDIRRVLKCRLTPRIAQKSAVGGCINLDAAVSLSLIYVDAEGGIRSYESVSSFTRSIEFKSVCEDVGVSASCRTDYCNCRARSERSFEVHAAITVSVSAVACNSARLLTDIDERSIRLRRGMSPASVPQGRADKYLLINDEVSLADKCPSIRNILRHDVIAVVRDKKIVGSKVVLKGELIMNVLYFGEETADCERFSDSVPFSQILEISDITEDCTCVCSAELISAELSPRTGMSGDMRVISVSAKVCLTAEAFCEGDVPYITDAYSTKYAMQLKKEDICFERVAASYAEPCVVKKTLDIPVSNDSRIVDMWCTAMQNGCSGAAGGIAVKGNVSFCVIIRDSSGEPSYYERIYDYESEINANLPELYTLKCSAEAVACSGSVTPDGIEVKAELLIACDVIEQSKQSVITEVELGEELERRHSPSSVIVYFASEGESVWDIARHYLTSPDAISSVNSLSSDIIPTAKTLVIPSV